jgi:hypothetical protein
MPYLRNSNIDKEDEEECGGTIGFKRTETKNMDNKKKKFTQFRPASSSNSIESEKLTSESESGNVASSK